MNGEFTTAVHALVYLANHPRLVSSEELARNVCTNPARIRKIMGKLRRAYLITTKEGVNGGYLLLETQDKINLCTILDAVGAPAVKEGWHSGGGDLTCLISTGMARVMDGITADLNQLCRKRLAQITIQNLSDKILKNRNCEGA